MFERSDDHMEGEKAESHAEREDSACLNEYPSFGALDERNPSERSDAAWSEA